MTGWHAITAGPSAGKTSVIRELSARGYRTAPEGARVVIDQAVSEGTDVESFRQTQAYTDAVLEADQRIEDNLPSPDEQDVFMDRTLADNIAYARLFGREIPDDIEERCRGRYDTVFLLEQIEFEDDYARTESPDEARQVHEELRAVYEELGYTVIDVELMPVDRRVDYIEYCVRSGPPAIY